MGQKTAMMVLRAAFLTAALLSLGAAAARAQSGEGVAAIVNSDLITTYDVRQRAALLIAFAEVEDLTPDLVRMAEEQALRSLIDEKLELQEAARFQILIDDEQVDDALAMLAEQSGTDLETNLAELRAAGVAIETLREQIRAEISWDSLVRGRYRDRIRISDDQVEEAMRALAQSLREPQYRVAEIFLEVRSAADEEAVLRQTFGVIEQLQAGASFPALAQQYSNAASARAGGDMGYLTLGEFPAEIAQQLQQLPLGGVAGPIRSVGGFYIVALIDRRDAASLEQLTLKAVVLPLGEGAAPDAVEAGRARMSQAAAGLNGCDAAEALAGRVDGAFVSDLGTLAGSSLQTQVRDAISGLQPGQLTAPITVPLGVQVFVLCDRQIGGPGLPSRQEIVARMEDQRRSMLARRYLRDLHREAAISIR